MDECRLKEGKIRDWNIIRNIGRRSDNDWIDEKGMIEWNVEDCRRSRMKVKKELKRKGFLGLKVGIGKERIIKIVESRGEEKSRIGWKKKKIRKDLIDREKIIGGKIEEMEIMVVENEEIEKKWIILKRILKEKGGKIEECIVIIDGSIDFLKIGLKEESKKMREIEGIEDFLGRGEKKVKNGIEKVRKLDKIEEIKDIVDKGDELKSRGKVGSMVDKCEEIEGKGSNIRLVEWGWGRIIMVEKKDEEEVRIDFEKVEIFRKRKIEREMKEKIIVRIVEEWLRSGEIIELSEGKRWK